MLRGVWRVVGLWSDWCMGFVVRGEIGSEKDWKTLEIVLKKG